MQKKLTKTLKQEPQMSLEEYKNKVEECLKMNYNDTEMEAKKSIMNYTEEFPMFYQENWDPSLVATAIVSGY